MSYIDKGEEMSLDPVFPAKQAAVRVFNQADSFERQPEDEEILGHLDKAAADLELTNRPY